MRFNDLALNRFATTIQGKFPYLNLGNHTDGVLLQAPLAYVSVTDDTVTLQYEISVLDAVGETIEYSELVNTENGEVVCSREECLPFQKQDLLMYRWEYRIRLIR